MTQLLTQKFCLLDEELLNEFESLSDTEQKDWLFVEPSEDFERAWKVDCFDPDFFYDFEDVIGAYSVVTMRNLDQFLDHAVDLKYKVVFTEDPQPVFDWWSTLRRVPDFSLNSEFEDAVNGMLPFQIEGLNYLKDVKYGGNAIWSTGTGKTALMTAFLKHYEDFNFRIVVVKKNNKRDMQVKLRQLGDVESVIVDGPPPKREKIYDEVLQKLKDGQTVTLICNYEKFRDDTEIMKTLVANRRVLIFWDEMPSKLANPGTQLYKAVIKVLFKNYGWKHKKWRPSELRQFQFTATPIENIPMDQLYCVRLIDPTIWPNVKDWTAEHVVSFNPHSHKPQYFKNLDKMRLQLEAITHQVDKSRPEIAKYFPAVVEDPQYIDWHPKDRAIYNEAQAMVVAKLEAGEDVNAFQLMGILQMICDNPEIVNASAENRLAFEEELLNASDDDLEEIKISGSSLALELYEGMGPFGSDHSTKLDRLHELIVKHADEKILVFSTWGSLGMPLIEEHLEAWGVSYRSYRGTEVQREAAKNEWREDEDIQVLLLSDAGSDSIDLPEASVVIHYNLPLKWSKLNQRQNRAHRINSKHASVTYYVLIMADSVEERVIEIITKKLGYHFELYKVGAVDRLVKAGITKDDLWYLLTGKSPDEMMI